MAFLTEAANRGSIATGYEIDNSCSFYDSDRTTTGTGANAHLDFTPSSTSNRKTGTFSSWVKRTYLDDIGVLFSSGTNQQHLRFNSNGVINIRDYNESTSLTTNAVFRDTSAWYHFVMAIDTTQSTASNRIKLYVNGDQITSFASAVYPTQNQDWNFNYSSSQMFIGARRWPTGGSNIIQGLDAYVAETNWIDGQQLTPSDFGEYDEDSSIWKPKKYTGSYGTNGFYLDFSDSANLGDDASGNSNNFTENNITSADQATDTPTNNFATLNVLNRNSASSGVTNNSIFTEGNTKITGNLSGYWQSGVSTIGITSGKWYFEATPYDSNTKICTIGYGDEADIENWGRNNDFPGAAGSKSYGYTGGTTAGYGQIIPSTNQPSPAVPYNQTNIIGVAIDADNGYVYWSKDGTYINSGNPASGSSGTGGIAVPTGTGTNGTLLPAVGFYYDGTIPAMVVNFGGYTQFTISTPASDANGYGTFEYAPPSGYYALCSKNLAEYG